MPSERSVRHLIDHAEPGGIPRLVLVLASLLMAIEAYDMQAAGLVAPSLIAEMHIGQATFGWNFSLTLLSYLVGSGYVGGLADLYGRRVVIVWGLVVLGVLTTLIAGVHEFWQFVMLRFLAGVGLGATIPAIVALNTEFGKVDARGRRVGTMYVGYTIGGVLTGLIASQVLRVADWRALFAIGGLAPLAFAIAAWRLLPESPFYLLQRPDRRGELVALLRRIDPAMRDADVEPSVATVARRRNPPIGLLFEGARRPMTIVLWLAFVFNFVTLHFITSWLPTLLHREGFGLAQAASLSSVLMLGGVGGSAVIGLLIDRRGIAPVWIVMAAAVPAMIAIGASIGHFWLLIVALGTTGFFLQGGLTGMNALSGLLYPPDIRSTSSGSAYGVGRIGSMVGPAVGGLLLGQGVSTVALLSIAAAPFAVGTVGAFVIWRLRRTSWPTAGTGPGAAVR